jgi:FKBP-type peptidyl-prolyl cis-trans isomerase 2
MALAAILNVPFLLLIVFFAGPVGAALAQMPVQPGDQVQVHYICHLLSGELADSTHADAKLAEAGPRARIYQPLENDAPLSFAAGRETSPAVGPKPHDFEDEIVRQLAQTVVGRARGEHFAVNIDGQQARPRENAKLSLARVRRRPLVLRMAPAEYLARTGREAEIGQAYAEDPDFPGTVDAVEKNEILIRFAGPPGNTLETPFGRAVVRQTEQEYLVDIDVRKGSLVRSGPMVGRIVEVGDTTFIVDYGHPLAGEDFSCEVTILPDAALAGK